MLSLHSSNAAARPRRSKSTSSIRSHQSNDHFAGVETERVAYNHAVAAAELAYERANGLWRAGRNDSENADRLDARHGSERPALARQKSIRFAGPSAVPMRSHSITRRNAPEHRPSTGERLKKAQTDSFASDDGLAVARGLAMAPPSSEDLLLGYRAASQPSSYRRLKKAKSMFALGKKPFDASNSGMPGAGGHLQRYSLRSSDSWGEPVRMPDPRLRKSFSFLRGVADRLPSNNRQYGTNDEAVQLARDQYVAQLEQQRLQSQPSFLSIITRRKPPKAFRRSVRSSSSDTYGSAIGSSNPAGDLGKSTGMSLKTRSLSQTLKKRLKKVFRIFQSGEGIIPAQHLEARCAHFGNGKPFFNDAERGYPPIPSPDAELLRRVGSRESMGRSSPIFVGSESRARSLHSIPSQEELSNEKSRVTSWTDSTATNTINVPLVERKRLSVIKEDGGPHQSSSSMRTYHDSVNAYAAFRQPYRQSSGTTPPEPQRVFSALQKEIIKKNSHPSFNDSDSTSESSSVHVSHRQLEFSQTNEDLTPQQIAELNEANESSSQRPLQETGSVFFHASKHIEPKPSTSPYRLIVPGSKGHDGSVQPYLSSSESVVHQPTFQPMAASYHFGPRPSESIYSRTSGGHTPRPAGSSVSLTKSGSSEEAGTAFIHIPDPARAWQGAKPFTQHRQVSDRSSNSSTEWKKGLASEMAYFDEHQINNKGLSTTRSTRGSGHKRERAQLDRDDAEINKSYRRNSSRMRPHECSLLQTSYLPALKTKPSHPLIERLPLLDTTSYPKSSALRDNENVPPARWSPSNQSSSHVANDRSHLSGGKGPIELRPKAGENSLRHGTENAVPSANTHSPQGPEHAERLRRLKSNSSLSLHKTTSAVTLAMKSGHLTENISVHNVGIFPSNPWQKDGTSKENTPRPYRTPTSQHGKHPFMESFSMDRRRTSGISEGPRDPAFL